MKLDMVYIVVFHLYATLLSVRMVLMVDMNINGGSQLTMVDGGAE